MKGTVILVVSPSPFIWKSPPPRFEGDGRSLKTGLKILYHLSYKSWYNISKIGNNLNLRLRIGGA